MFFFLFAQPAARSRTPASFSLFSLCKMNLLLKKWNLVLEKQLEGTDLVKYTGLFLPRLKKYFIQIQAGIYMCIRRREHVYTLCTLGTLQNHLCRV